MPNITTIGAEQGNRISMNSSPVVPPLLSGLAPESSDAGMSDALRESNARFAILCDAMPQMVWSTLPDGFHDYYNARWYEFTGVPDRSTDGEGWNGMFHPDDQDRAWARWRQSLETGEPYEIEYRLRHHSGRYRWTLGRALPVRDDAGVITRWIGTCTDIDDQKRANEQNEILSRELSHRIKNIFAVIGGLIALSARRNPQAKSFADELRGRITALGRAHEFVRPHSDESQPLVGTVTLKTMLSDLMSAYPARDEARLRIEGDDIGLDDRGATPIALVFHELATNAAKYGALSVAEGSVVIETRRVGDSIRISWTESDGPPVVGKPERQGFGTRLTDMSVVQQLGGTLEREWLPAGLRVNIEIRAERLVRN
jgi:PAS domain S-box-containing protein